jgi:hypothetical protein
LVLLLAVEVVVALPTIHPSGSSPDAAQSPPSAPLLSTTAPAQTLGLVDPRAGPRGSSYATLTAPDGQALQVTIPAPIQIPAVDAPPAGRAKSPAAQLPFPVDEPAPTDAPPTMPPGDSTLIGLQPPDSYQPLRAADTPELTSLALMASGLASLELGIVVRRLRRRRGPPGS